MVNRITRDDVLLFLLFLSLPLVVVLVAYRTMAEWKTIIIALSCAEIELVFPLHMRNCFSTEIRRNSLGAECVSHHEDWREVWDGQFSQCALWWGESLKWNAKRMEYDTKFGISSTETRTEWWEGNPPTFNVNITIHSITEEEEMPTWQGGRTEREKEEELVAFFLTEENQFQLPHK